jgi:hypothetical protein
VSLTALVSVATLLDSVDAVASAGGLGGGVVDMMVENRDALYSFSSTYAMTNIYVPESIPIESQTGNSQRYGDYTFEPTQLSQPVFSQTQNTQGISSQVEPRRKYCKSLVDSTDCRGPVHSDQFCASHPQITLG